MLYSVNIAKENPREGQKMATRIHNTSKGEIVEAKLITSNGIDFLFDVMGNSGVPASVIDEAEFDLDDYETEWWLRWAEREQRILDKTEELGEEAEMVIAQLAAEYGHDFELLQDKEEEFLFGKEA